MNLVNIIENKTNYYYKAHVTNTTYNIVCYINRNIKYKFFPQCTISIYNKLKYE